MGNVCACVCAPAPRGFSCRDAAFGEYVRYRCTLDTSFGSTKPLR